MSSESVISVEGLGKRYRIGLAQKRSNSFREALRRAAVSPFRYLQSRLRGATEEETLWALRDVSFEVQQGEVLGIIGRNGAGKSTLLKILSRITDPTEGRAIVRGRVNSLLEVGTGFHPELTGRENIYMNAAMHGMRRAEITRKLDEIIAFAEVEKFVDTPVKRYSSGMYTRLAFAVAAHVEPDILIVDEVLAVGDAAFQKKCLGKMGEVATIGRTVLFVSHNMAAVSTLCPRAMLLSLGHVTQMGPCADVIAGYYSSLETSPQVRRASGDDICEFVNARIVDSSGRSVIQVDIGEGFSVEMTYRIKRGLYGQVIPNYHFYTASGICCFIAAPPSIEPVRPGQYVARCHVPAYLLNEGAYAVGLACTTFFGDRYTVNFFEEGFLLLNVRDPKAPDEFNYGFAQTVPGVVRPRLQWDIEENGQA